MAIKSGRKGRHGRVVPWASWEDWLAVKDALLPEPGPTKASTEGEEGDGATREGTEGSAKSAGPSSSTERSAEWALGVVDLWRARGRVPLAVDATADLIRIRSQGSPSCYMQRLTLSMALVRLVNGVSGALQKGVYAQSVASLAESVGLPRILVDLRHEATHNALPSVNTLSIAADQALGWLSDNYWSLQLRELRERDERIAEVRARPSILRSLAHSLTRSLTDSLADLLQILRHLLDLSVKSSLGDDEGSTKRHRAELVKEVVDLVHTSQSPALVSPVHRLVAERPFAPKEAKGWTTFLNKIGKYYPSLGLLLMQECWEAAKASAQANRSDGGERDFLRWMVGADHLTWREGWDGRHVVRALYAMVVEGTRVAKDRARGGTHGGNGGGSDLVPLLRSLFQFLFASDDLTPDVFEGLRILDAMLGHVSGYAGPDILLGKRRGPGDNGDNGAAAGAAGEGEGEDGDGRAGKSRWKRCRRWTPCAVGNLPSASHPNGV